MASVLRWALAYWTLAQALIFCGASGDPVHIQLNLDGKEIIKDEEDYDRLPNLKYDTLERYPNLVKLWYNSQNPTTPMYNDAAQRGRVESPGLKKLYIRGKFTIGKFKGYKKQFRWDNKRKGAKELGEFVLKIFKPDAVVIVVFPDDLQTYTGFRFQKMFEEEVQSTNEKITVGRSVINVYLGLGDQNQQKRVEKLLEEETNNQRNALQKRTEKKEKYFSIFANYHLNRFSFRTVLTAWRTELYPVNIYQVKIQEADSVAVKLMSVCTSTNGFKVGSQTEQGVADILVKLLRVKDVETHPIQRVRVALLNNCGTAKEREEFTDRLVDNLISRGLRAFGKEPQVHVQVYNNERKGDAFDKDVNKITASHQQDIVGEIKNGDVISQVNEQHRKSVSSAKELFIHIHCHGVFSGNGGTVCGKDSAALAQVLFKFTETLLVGSVPKNGFVKFHVCEGGDEEGQKYVIDFLTKFEKLLETREIKLQESLSYLYETSQIKEHTQVTVPCAARYDSETWPNVNEKQVFGRFTVRTIKQSGAYKAFRLLPLTEYKLFYP